MGLAFSLPALVTAGAQQIPLSSLIATTAAAAPEYVVLVGLDRDRYTAASTGERGTLSGNGHSAAFTNYAGSDNDSLGLVFSYTEHGYYNSTYGYLADMTLTTSGDNLRSETLSLYGFGSAGTPNAALLAKLQAEVDKPFYNGSAFMVAGSAGDPLGYSPANFLGTLDVVTRAHALDATPGQATPQEIAAVANSFIGQAWNDNGCWILANDIAALAGASLPLTSDETHPAITPPVANGEWIVAYNSATASVADRVTWQSLLRTGDVVVANNSCGGHIATVVSGASYSAYFLDNSGPASSDGAAHDIVIDGPRQMLSWAIGPDLDNVVIYRLDAPVVTVTAPMAMHSGDGAAIAPLISTLDPAGKAITGYQVYSSGAGNLLANDALLVTAHSAATAVSIDAAAMAALAYKAGAAGSDSIMLRATNGSYWGDWQTIPVAVGSGVQSPVLTVPHDTVFIHGGEATPVAALFSSSAGSGVTSYTISSPAYGGAVLLNGATNLLGGGDGAIYGDQRYEVSAADLAKLTYVAGTNLGAEDIVITAHNGAALASMPATITLTTVAPTTHGISHWVATGADVPLSSLMSVTLADATPLNHYAIDLNVSIIDWGPNTPSHGTTLMLNGATDLMAGSGAPPGFYRIPVADIDKVTLHAASDAGVFFVDIRANDGADGTPGLLTITTVAEASGLTALAATVHAGDALAVSALFSQLGAPAAYYRFTDPAGAGQVELDHSGTNLQSKGDDTPGLFIVQASDLDKLSYSGGTSNASEWLTVSTSSDMLHWSAEAQLKVTSIGTTRSLTGGGGNDSFTTSASNDVIDGGAGVDTVFVGGKRADYTLTSTGASLSLADKAAVQGVDTFTHIERLVFDDAALAFDLDGSAGQVFRLFETILARAPRPNGMGWWMRAVDNGSSLASVAQAMEQSDEYAGLYGSNVSDADFAAHLYQNAMHSAPDAATLAALADSLHQGYSRTAMTLDFAHNGQYIAQLIGTIDAGIAYTYTAA
jgi:hypothetical protein